MQNRAPLLLALLLASTAWVGTTRAKEPEPRPPRKVAWDPAWPRFRPVEWAVTGAFGAADVAILLFVKDPPVRTSGGIVFDDAVSHALRGKDADTRQAAQDWSNLFYNGGTAIGLVEAPLTALVVHGNADVAWQLSLINVEAFALGGFVQLASNRLVGRERPFVEHCKETGETGFPCQEGGRSLGFSAGHTMTTFIAAGVTCAHHAHLPLWGNAVADASACAVAVGVAAADGVLRITADKHWASDVLLGTAIGFGFGYGIPTLLHYRGGSNPLEKKDARSWRPVFLAPVPYVAPDRLGIAWSGAF